MCCAEVVGREAPAGISSVLQCAHLSLPAEPRALRLQVPFETWRDDEDLRLITERLVEIVGEAARAMTPETETLGHQSTGQD
jgi:hypothetical protein